MNLAKIAHIITAPSDSLAAFRHQFVHSAETHCPSNGFDNAYEHFKDGVMKEQKLTRKRGLLFFPISRMRTGGGIDTVQLGDFSHVMGCGIIGWVWFTHADLKKVGIDVAQQQAAELAELKEQVGRLVLENWHTAH